ncbi:MAG: hypothetical protein R3F62_28945 [Planctomycetota bacterium]
MDAETYFTNLALAAYVDGEVDAAELQLLEQHATNLRLTSEAAQRILNQVASGVLKTFSKPKGKEARYGAFKAVVRILRVDGKLRSKEQRMIKLLGMHMEIDDDTIDAALSAKWSADG